MKDQGRVHPPAHGSSNSPSAAAISVNPSSPLPPDRRTLASHPQSWWSRLRRWYSNRSPERDSSTSPQQVDAAPRALPAPLGLEVITLKATVESARVAWQEQNRERIETLVKRPGTIIAHDARTMWLLRANREAVIARLRAIWLPANPPAIARLHAYRVMNALGETVAPEALAATASESLDAGIVLLEILDQFAPEGASLPPALHDFVLNALTNAHPGLRAAAWHEVNERRLRDAEPLLDQLRDQSGAETDFAAAWMRPNEDTLQRIADKLRVRPSREDLHGLYPVIELGRSTNDAGLRSEAARVAAEFLVRLGEKSHPEGEAHGALDWLAELPERELALELLERVAQESLVWRMRAAALAHLRELDAPRAEALLERNAWTLPEEFDETVAENIRTTPVDESSLRTVESWAQEFITRGLFDAEEMRTALQAMRSRSVGLDALITTSLAAYLLAASANRTLEISYGHLPDPWRHDWLLQDLAASSGSRFHPIAISEEASEDPGQNIVQFIHGARLYRFVARVGREGDEAAVLAAVTQALTDAGLSERFVPMPDIAEEKNGLAWIFADPAKLRDLDIQL